MAQKTDCIIRITQEKSPATQPLTIYIESKTVFSQDAWSRLREAKKRVEEVLFNFLGDENSNLKLMYDLAMNAGGTYNFRRSGDIVFQYCHSQKMSLYMTLVYLPCVQEQGVAHCHGEFLLYDNTREWLIDGTGCFYEVYGFECMPVCCAPYVVIWGKNPSEVDHVAGRVSGKIRKHQRECEEGCRFTFCTNGEIASTRYYRGR